MTRFAFLMASLLLPLPAVAATFVLGEGSSPGSSAPPPTVVTHQMPAFHPPPARTDFSIPPGFAPAPMPNLDLRSPSPLQSNGSPELSGSLFASPAASNVHNGYMYGSSYSTELERRSRAGVTSSLAPTLNLKIPLQ